MRITKIKISNVKGISDLEKISDKDTGFSDGLNILYGLNGSGKTTLLECLSLIGHLGSIPIVISNGKELEPFVFNSFFRESWALTNAKTKLKFETHSLFDQLFDLPDVEKVKSQIQSSLTSLEVSPSFESPKLVAKSLQSSINDVDELFANLSGNPNFGVIELEVCCGSQKDILVFVCINDDGVSQHTINVTDMLSMAQNDFIFGNTITCVVHSRFTEFWSDFRKLCFGRGYQIIDDDHEVVWHPKIDLNTSVQQQCTYINTDLYDFGRGNDLRESPKRMGQVAFRELVTRLNLPFSDQVRDEEVGYDFVNLDELEDELEDKLSLNGALTRIFPERSERKIYRFWHEANNLRVKFIENNDIYEIQHLSLGENEVFFIIAVLLSGKFDDGVAILDEPAGGLAPKSSALFYQEINEIADKKNIQIFISSHKLEPVLFLQGAKILELKKDQKTHLLSIASRVALEFENYTGNQVLGLNILKDQIEISTSGIAETLAPHSMDEIMKDQTSKLKESARTQINFLIGIFVALLALNLAFISAESATIANFFRLPEPAVPIVFKITKYGFWIMILILLSAVINYCFLAYRNSEVHARVINKKIELALKTNTDTILLNTLKRKIDRKIFEQNHPLFGKIIKLIEYGHGLTSWTIRKTLTFASFHILVSFGLVLLFTKSLQLSGGVAASEFFILIFIYYLMEKSDKRLQ